MHKKNIEKKLKNKMEEWIKTLPENLQKLTRNNVLISGGAICSLLTDEKVNDYDVYIKDRGVLKKLVEHYTKSFSEITVLDGVEKEKLMKENEVSENDQSFGLGVAIRTLKPEQIKLFFEQGGLKTNEDVLKEDLNYHPLFFSPNAITLSNDVQLIIRFHGDSKKIHETFDFVHATNYFTFKEGLVLNKEALTSLVTKQLRYAGSLYPLTSIIRMRKFIKRGWEINAGDIMKILFQVSELDLKNIDVLEEQLVGVDVLYFQNLISCLREENKELTRENLNEIIDRVFNSADFFQDED